jgi:lipoprotein-anchoring transpeptidase ErfK/SrfK
MDANDRTNDARTQGTTEGAARAAATQAGAGLVLDRRVAMPLVAALAAGLLLVLAESPATAQSQGAPSIVIDPASLPPLVPAAAPAPPVPDVMAPGDYDWAPERSLAGDVVIVVSLPQQLVHVYRGGVRIGVSTISTGKPGHDTPTGVFTILQKKKMHRSTLYDDAPMPFMQRLTWDGVALHAGRIPGYPASHGCVRLPAAFAELLYGVTDHAGVVVVADDTSFPADIVRPGERASAGLLAVAARAVEEGGADAVVAAVDGAAAGAEGARQGTGAATP